MIVCDPRVLSTDANLVLLSIALGPLPNLYIYRPAGEGDGGPSLTRLEWPLGKKYRREKNEISDNPVSRLGPVISITAQIFRPF